MKKKRNKSYRVDISFQAYTFYDIKATTEAEAKKKALARLSRKQLKSMVDKQNTYADKN